MTATTTIGQATTLHASSRVRMGIVFAILAAGINQLSEYGRNYLDANIQPLEYQPPAIQAPQSGRTLHLLNQTPLQGATQAASPAAIEQIADRVFRPISPAGQAAADSEGKTAAAKPAIDYFDQLKKSSAIRVDGIADNGAFINGAFIPVGAAVEEFAYPKDASTTSSTPALVVPTLYKINPGQITIREPVKPWRTFSIHL